MRLIDADDLERSAEFFLHSDGGIHKDSFYAMLNIMPTLSDVKHGHWVLGFPLNECSVCGGSSPCKVRNWQPVGFNSEYCPHCGAKMDGGESDA